MSDRSPENDSVVRQQNGLSQTPEMCSYFVICTTLFWFKVLLTNSFENYSNAIYNKSHFLSLKMIDLVSDCHNLRSTCGGGGAGGRWALFLAHTQNWLAWAIGQPLLVLSSWYVNIILSLRQ